MINLLRDYKIKETDYRITIYGNDIDNCRKPGTCDITTEFYCNLHQVIDSRVNSVTYILARESAQMPTHWSIKNIPMPSTLPIIYPKDTLGNNLSLELGDLLDMGLLEEFRPEQRKNELLPMFDPPQRL